MGRELADFLEEILPSAISGVVQFVVSAVFLFYFSPALALSACGVLVGMISVYALFHSTFWRWNRALNEQMEHQVSVLEQRRDRPVLAHLKKLRRFEVKLSDTESHSVRRDLRFVDRSDPVQPVVRNAKLGCDTGNDLFDCQLFMGVC